MAWHDRSLTPTRPYDNYTDDWKDSWTPWTWHDWQSRTDPVDDLEQRLASREKQLTEARERIERQDDLIARMQRQIEALQSLTLPQAEATPNSCKKQAESTPNSCKKQVGYTPNSLKKSRQFQAFLTNSGFGTRLLIWF